MFVYLFESQSEGDPISLGQLDELYQASQVSIRLLSLLLQIFTSCTIYYPELLVYMVCLSTDSYL